jgi:DNA-binding LacI/PurR family transcriptional regulator
LVSEAIQTFGLYRKLEEAGLKPGRDISVMGLLPEQRVQMLSPPLTTFTTDWTAIGTHLGEALIDALPGGAPARNRSKSKTMELVAPAIFVDGASVHRVRSPAGKS